MAWRDELEDGIKEMHADGAGVSILWKGATLRALIGSGQSYEALVNGGYVDNEAPTITVLKSDILAAAGSGAMFETEDIVTVEGVTEYRVRAVNTNPAVPHVQVMLKGADQE
jgi:hypothetical protein